MATVYVISKKEVTKLLLERYKTLPCLWKRSDPQYSNLTVRKSALLELLPVMKMYDPDATLDNIRRLLENMRTSYKRERKKIRDSQSVGKIHKPLLWYYPYLKFLDENPDSSVDDPDPEMTEISQDEEPAIKRTKTEKRWNVAHPDTPLQNEETINVFENVVSSSAEKTSADAFGCLISTQLNALTDKVQRCLAEKLMGEIMCYAKMKCLNMNTSIDLKQDSLHRRQYVKSRRYSQQSQQCYIVPECSYSRGSSVERSSPSPHHQNIDLQSSPPVEQTLSQHLLEAPNPPTTLSSQTQNDPSRSPNDHYSGYLQDPLQQQLHLPQRLSQSLHQPSSLRIISNQQIKAPEYPIETQHHKTSTANTQTPLSLFTQHSPEYTSNYRTPFHPDSPDYYRPPSQSRSPVYTRQSPVYAPKSPEYYNITLSPRSETSPIYHPISPVNSPQPHQQSHVHASHSTYLQHSSRYEPLNPQARPQSPVYPPLSPNYLPKSPVYNLTASPRYESTSQSLAYALDLPEYAPLNNRTSPRPYSPVYPLPSPNYLPESPVFNLLQSPPQRQQSHTLPSSNSQSSANSSHPSNRETLTHPQCPKSPYYQTSPPNHQTSPRPQTPEHQPISPYYPKSPRQQTSPRPQSPQYPQTPRHQKSPRPQMPEYRPQSPTYRPQSPQYPKSPRHETSPPHSPNYHTFRPQSPIYRPQSPYYSKSPRQQTSPRPQSPQYPKTLRHQKSPRPKTPEYRPQSPTYRPQSPQYPKSPRHETSPPHSPNYHTFRPQSPIYRPQSPYYSKSPRQQTSPRPQSPQYPKTPLHQKSPRPQSPEYRPQSPYYRPKSPQYPNTPHHQKSPRPQTPEYRPQSPYYRPKSPQYPKSPCHQTCPPHTQSPLFRPQSPRNLKSPHESPLHHSNHEAPPRPKTPERQPHSPQSSKSPHHQTKPQASAVDNDFLPSLSKNPPQKVYQRKITNYMKKHV